MFASPHPSFSENTNFIIRRKLAPVPPLRAGAGGRRDAWPPGGTKWGWGQQPREWEPVSPPPRLMRAGREGPLDEACQEESPFCGVGN